MGLVGNWLHSLQMSKESVGVGFRLSSTSRKALDKVQKKFHTLSDTALLSQHSFVDTYSICGSWLVFCPKLIYAL